MKIMREFWSSPGVRRLSVWFLVFLTISICINSLVTIWAKDIIEAVANGTDTALSLALFFSVLVFQTGVNYGRTRLRREISQVSWTDIMNRLCDKVLHLDYATFTDMGEGKVDSAFDFTASVSIGGAALCQLLEAVINFIIVAVVITMMQPPMLIAIICIYSIGAFVVYKVNGKITILDKKATELREKRKDIIRKIVYGFSEVRALNTQDYHLESFKDINGQARQAFRNKVTMIGNLNACLDGIDTIMMMAILLYSPIMIRNGMSTATSMALIMYGWRLVKPLIDAVDCFDQYSQCKQEFIKYQEFMAIPVTVKEGKLDLKRFDSRIRFERVSFKYSNSDEVLNDVSFTVKKGQKVGIVGMSGCGKSTMLKLLERFYDPTEGRILIDGIDIKDCTFKSLHSRIGIVQQDTYAFKGTIFENLTYGMDTVVPMHIAIAACKRAAIYDFINSLPKKFETDIGPNGLKLSGGQRQRIAIARVLIQDPDIILLDEATSSLDNESEGIVQQALDSLRGKTIITVAHRLGTVKNSDKLIVMDEHRIVEEGTHEDLMAAGGVYARLYKEKKGGTLS